VWTEDGKGDRLFVAKQAANSLSLFFPKLIGDKMIAYRIKLNEKIVAIAGQDDWSILSTHVTASRDNGCNGVEDYIQLSVHGLSKENKEGFCEHFRWPELDLNIGDKVEIEVVDVQKIDPPRKRYRSDSKVQENPFTAEELKEMRYKDYLELKEEFEGA